MAARKTPSKGGKPDKIMRSAIMLALHREVEGADGQNTKRLNIIAAKLVDMAASGDMQAIKEINERVDGKVPQALVGDESESPISLVHKVERVIVRAANPDD